MAQLSAIKYIFSKHIHPLRNTHYWGLCSSQACSFLYLLMRSNFEFSGAQGTILCAYFRMSNEAVLFSSGVIVKLHLYYADFFRFRSQLKGLINPLCKVQLAQFPALILSLS